MKLKELLKELLDKINLTLEELIMDLISNANEEELAEINNSLQWENIGEITDSSDMVKDSYTYQGFVISENNNLCLKCSDDILRNVSSLNPIELYEILVNLDLK